MRGDMMLLNQVNGSVVWTYELGSPIIGSPGVSTHGIVVGAQDGTIYCLGTPTVKK
ncbi:MAG: PQQ-binding-like beta-propeller repeat protein [Bacteroidia bacterium]|nr:PQQ-binding-like beta-propeller repeat protein [Bacteroidia bacterium]